MKIRRLVVKDFAAIRESDIEFGPGLNVLYGPNDLGKSTLADAIRLALLLPHTSSHIEDYVPWAGGQNPRVELTFETEAQRIWRVKKEFRKGGASVLGSFLDARLIDEFHIFVAPRLAGGRMALSAVGGLGVERMDEALRLSEMKLESLEGDCYFHGFAPASNDHAT